MEKKIKLIIIILSLLFMSGCIEMMFWGIDTSEVNKYSLQGESIEFQLKGDEFLPETPKYLNYPRVFVVDIKGKNMAGIIRPSYSSSFMLYTFHFYTKSSSGNYYHLDNQIYGMYYDPKSGKIFGVNYITYHMKTTKQCFVVGKGEIKNGQFRADFLKGVGLTLVRSHYKNNFDFFYMEMYLPYRYKDLEFLDLPAPTQRNSLNE